MTKEQTEAHIKALIYERDGYLRVGRKDDAAEVDAELARYGHQAKTPAKRATKMTKPKADTEL